MILEDILIFIPVILLLILISMRGRKRSLPKVRSLLKMASEAEDIFMDVRNILCPLCGSKLVILRGELFSSDGHKIDLGCKQCKTLFRWVGKKRKWRLIIARKKRKK